MMVTIAPGYKGQCHCGKDAVHEQWCDFGEPSSAALRVAAITGLPAIRGVWNYVCDDHYQAEAVHTKAELQVAHPELFA